MTPLVSPDTINSKLQQKMKLDIEKTETMMKTRH